MSAATTVTLSSSNSPEFNLAKLRDTAVERLVEARRARESYESLVQIYASSEVDLQALVDKYEAAIEAIRPTGAAPSESLESTTQTVSNQGGTSP